MPATDLIISSARLSLNLSSKSLQQGVRTHPTLKNSTVRPTILEAAPTWRQFRAQHCATQHQHQVAQQVRAMTLKNMQARRKVRWEQFCWQQEVRIPTVQGIDGLID